MILQTIFGFGEDSFADRLEIPAGIEIAEPVSSADQTIKRRNVPIETVIVKQFADGLEIPAGIEYAEPVSSANQAFKQRNNARMETVIVKQDDIRLEIIPASSNDQKLELQNNAHKALVTSSSVLTKYTPSPKKNSTSHAKTIHENIKAFLNRHVLMERKKPALLTVRDEAGLDGAGEQAIHLHPFRLLEGFQPGMYGVEYSLNLGEPGSVYLKEFEVTKGTPLSVNALEVSSKTRMQWSTDPSQRFVATVGFRINEGDWRKPYAARFEVWFKSDASKTEHKIAERIFKIYGWHH